MEQGFTEASPDTLPVGRRGGYDRTRNSRVLVAHL